MENIADRIKGITIEINGDTTGLKDALKSTNKTISDTQQELKDVERLLRWDPSNTVLLEQKQRLLGESVESTKDKLKKLKDANEQLKDSVKNYDAWAEKHAPIQTEIDSTKTKLKDLQSQAKQMQSLGEIDTDEYKNLQTEIKDTKKDLSELQTESKKVSAEFGNPISPKQYDSVQREIAETENKLKNLQTQAKNSSVALSQISTAAGNVAGVAGNVASNTKVATVAIAGLGAVAFSAASDMEESQNKVDVAFKDSAQSVKDFADSSLENFGIAEGTALDMASTFGDMATSMKVPTGGAADMATSLTGLAADLSSFKNIGIDQAMTALNGVFTGETESLKGIGVVMTQANLEAFALSQGIEKNIDDMTEAEKVNLRYAYVLESTKNAQGDYARTSDGAANSLRAMQESTKEAAAEFGEVLLPIITPIIQKVTEAIKAFGAMDDKQKTAIVTVLALVAVISPVAGIISAISSAISFLAANPIVLLIAAIVGLVVLIVTKGDEMKAKLQEISTFLNNIFATDFTKIFGPVLGSVLNAFFANIQNIFNAVMRIFNGIIDFVQSVFAGEWENAWMAIQEIFGGVFDGLIALVKAPFNAIIGIINAGISGIVSALNSLNFDVPDWVPGLGGKKFGFNLTAPQIPFLAKGGTVLKGSAVVGEAGPELLTVANSGKTTVTPLTGQYARGTATGTIIQLSPHFYGYKPSQGAQFVKDLNNQLGKLYI